MSERPTAFTLVHGRYHTGDSWKNVQEVLADHGYPSIAPTLEVGDSLDESAHQIEIAEIEFAKNSIIRVGWSLGANVVPRFTTENVRELIYIAPSFDQSTIKSLTLGNYEANHTVMYDVLNILLSRIEDEDERLNALKSIARDAFYNDVQDQEVLDKALDCLRLHPKYPDKQPDLAVFPVNLPAYLIATTKDATTNYFGQLAAAEVVGAVTVDFESGHAPLISRPRELAELLIKLSVN